MASSLKPLSSINPRKFLFLSIGFIVYSSFIYWMAFTMGIETSSIYKNASCPVKKIGFMKTHKTASSTVQSILFRFGLDHNLNFVLPSSGNHLSHPGHRNELTEPFKRKWLDWEEANIPWHSKFYKDKKYDIFNLHTVWNKIEVRDLLGPDAVYITILRHPVEQFESLYAYYTNLSLNLSLHEYVERLSKIKNLYKRRQLGYLGLNQQLYDLGLPTDDLFDTVATEERIKEIDEEFDLVLISEKFDESMILLANELCWPLDYVKSFKLNARKSNFKVTLSPKERETLERWQEGDMLLYNHFKNRLEEKINQYGQDRIKKDLRELQDLNLEVKDRCILSEGDRANLTKKSYQPWSPEVIGYNIKSKDNDCRFLAMAELFLVDYARKKQEERWQNDEFWII